MMMRTAALHHNSPFAQQSIRPQLADFTNSRTFPKLPFEKITDRVRMAAEAELLSAMNRALMMTYSSYVDHHIGPNSKLSAYQRLRLIAVGLHPSSWASVE